MSLHPPIIAPSLLAADYGRFAEEIRSAHQAGGDWLHLDIMDGHFVDNISFGPEVVRTAAKLQVMPLDVHLMITSPDRYLSRFLECKPEVLTVHLEARHSVPDSLKAIRDAGVLAGLAINPPTPFQAIEPFLSMIDVVLIMTVNPGFGGQPFLEGTLPKIQEAARTRTDGKFSYRIEVDGGIDRDTAKRCHEAGADTFVAGSSVFSSDDRAGAISAMRSVVS
ncbi:MAG: ribulose-phosphate 3-epimerase [Verrucomicrobiales bacterium]